MPEMNPSFITPDWDAPENVVAISTLRYPGVSKNSYEGCNLATHVGDNLQDVETNRTMLQSILPESVSVRWLNQVHGTEIVQADQNCSVVSADASFTKEPGVACCIMVADCMPVLMTTSTGNIVAAVHGGWRGLAGGILETTVKQVFQEDDEVIAWLGPAIGACHFEVGPEVKESFEIGSIDSDSSDYENCFSPSVNEGKYMADLYKIVRAKLSSLGVNSIHGGGFCTYCQESEFYSHRRQNPTGRMASLIYLK